MDTEADKIINLANYSSIESLVCDKVTSMVPSSKLGERSFYVADMFDVYKKLLLWNDLMPRIKPYYAVKCNNLPEIVKFLATLGVNFDCASKQEIQQVLKLGVQAERIIYANPCKTNSFIKYAQSVKVNLMTFDNELELRKVAQHHPNAKLVLRIKGDEANSTCKFNIKFGADVEKCYDLLKLARQLNLNVIGVSFHNGSNCNDPLAYYRSIEASRRVFDLAEQLGFHFTILDIGGGFPGEREAGDKFEAISLQVNWALERFFPIGCGVEIIAEPGRFFVASALTLVCMVNSKRLDLDSPPKLCNYYLNDGIYGGFMNVMFDYQVPEPKLIKSAPGQAQQVRRSSLETVLWGPTCDSIDCIKRDFIFPELHVGEWLMFPNMGAYTLCCATSFNGFERAYVVIADNLAHPTGSYLKLCIDSARSEGPQVSAISCSLSDVELEATQALNSRQLLTLIQDSNPKGTGIMSDAREFIISESGKILFADHSDVDHQQQQRKNLNRSREYLFLKDQPISLNSEERATDIKVTTGQ